MEGQDDNNLETNFKLRKSFRTDLMLYILQCKFVYVQQWSFSLCILLLSWSYTTEPIFHCYYGNSIDFANAKSAKKFVTHFHIILGALVRKYHSFSAKYSLKVRKLGFLGFHGNSFHIFWILVNRHPKGYISWKFQVSIPDGCVVIM